MKIERDIANCIKDKRIIGVAISGGKDSMALLNLLIDYRNTVDNDLVIKAINIDHSLRGADSVKDSQFVIDYCKSLDIECISTVVDVPEYVLQTKKSEELAARELRYNFFDSLVKDGKVQLIAIAHHFDDQLETIIMRLMRGTGIKGLRGILPISGHYIRPLLGIKREQIDDYITQNDIPFREDRTNTEVKYTRNFIRLKLLPEIKNLVPDIERIISSIVNHSRSIMEKLEPRAASVQLIRDAAFININQLDKGDLTTKILLDRAYELLGYKQDIEAKHLKEIKKLLKCQNGTYIDMPFSTKAYKEYCNIAITKKAAPQRNTLVNVSQIETLLDNNESYLWKQVTKCIDDYNNIITIAKKRGKNHNDICEAGELVLLFDPKKMPSTVTMRGPKDGDMFQIVGGKNKLLSDYLTDVKFPQRLKERLQLLCQSNQVLYIIGYAVSEQVKCDNAKSYLAYKYGGLNV